MDGIEPAIAGKILGLRVVVHCRGILKGNPYTFFAGWKQACLLVGYLSDRMVCVSEAVRSQMVEAGCNPLKLSVVPDGVDLPMSPSFDLPERVTSQAVLGKGPIVGCVARINPQKGYPTLLRAFAIVKRSIPNARLVIVGGGVPSYIRRMKDLAIGLGIYDRTEFVGEVFDVGSYYAKFRVLAVPSRAEGFGLTYVEAGLYGVPAIGTSSGGASEIIEDGTTGFIIPPENPELLAKWILSILNNHEQGKIMGKRAKDRVTRLFSVSGMVKGVERVYQELERDEAV
jgi:glycosyltransferase involved in cell wall biosynthesis